MFKFPIGSNKISNNPLQFEYINWKGEKGIRTVIPQEIYYGENDFHKGNQWLLEAFDVDKQANRHFAIKDIIRFIDNKEDYKSKDEIIKCWCCNNENVIKGWKCNNCGEIV